MCVCVCVLTFSGSTRKFTSDSPSPSCPAAIKVLDKPGTGPITGFPPGTVTNCDKHNR